MKGCPWSLLHSPNHAGSAGQRSRTPGGKRHGSPPGPRLLGESHVCSVEQVLLPPVGAHQSHRLLIQPNLRHI